jgi:phosphate transport system permease protein
MSPDSFQFDEKTNSFQRSGFSFEGTIKFFFASNAGLTIVILLLIMVFLIKEGLGFFPNYRRELEVYRIAGLEFVDISRENLTAQEQMSSLLNRAYFAEINGKSAKEMRRSEEVNAINNFFLGKISSTRDLYIQNTEEGKLPSKELISSLEKNFAQQKLIALSSLPETPHLTIEERSEIIDFLTNQEITNVEESPFITKLNSDLSTAQEIHTAPLADFKKTIDSLEAAALDLSSVVSEMSNSVRTTKEAIQNADILETNRKTLLSAANNAKDQVERTRLVNDAEALLAEKPSIEKPMKLLLEKRGACIAANNSLKDVSISLISQFPQSFSQPNAQRLLNAAKKAWPTFISNLEKTPHTINSWKNDEPVKINAAIISFFTGKNWITGGEWQDFYGILPLLIGSIMICIVALLIAIPTGIISAIYVNQFASKYEQSIIKPVIEFIQAIPSVVLGFVGVLLFGTALRDLSMNEALSWMPGFPIDERLNIFTAGCLLAFMSIPTIFSLAEDALNNVPQAYAEASEALGASKIQTTFRIIVPAAFSGIMAAILLGLGRVIGETMVVLLVAGNRIKIPDFTSGIGTFFQPAHTLTGIIAQELGEVALGSVHYRALFVIGIFLFAIVLLINATAHRFVGKMKH